MQLTIYQSRRSQDNKQYLDGFVVDPHTHDNKMRKTIKKASDNCPASDITTQAIIYMLLPIMVIVSTLLAQQKHP